MKVTQLGPKHISAIVGLRQSEYLRKFGDQFHPQKFEWNDIDAKSIHLGLLQNDDLLSVLRLTLLDDPEDFEKTLVYPYSSEEFPGKILYLARASTQYEYQGQGFHLLLRYHAFKWALENKCRWILGTMESGASRLPLLKQMGYEFIHNSNGWSGWAHNKRPALIGRLDLKKNAAQALEVLQHLLAQKDLL